MLSGNRQPNGKNFEERSHCQFPCAFGRAGILQTERNPESLRRNTVALVKTHAAACKTKHHVATVKNNSVGTVTKKMIKKD